MLSTFNGYVSSVKSLLTINFTGQSSFEAQKRKKGHTPSWPWAIASMLAMAIAIVTIGLHKNSAPLYESNNRSLTKNFKE